MTAKKTKVTRYQLASERTQDSSNKTEHFSYKSEWANAQQDIYVMYKKVSINTIFYFC